MANNTTAFAEGSVGYPLPATNIISNKLFGAGKTEGQRGAYSASPAANARANQILQDIQSAAGMGTFNEGQFNKAYDSFSKLKSELDSGKLSQADYATISDQVLPSFIQYGHQIAGTGQKAAQSVIPTVQKLEELNKDAQIYKAGQTYLGRDLTPAELAQFKPKFADGADIGNAYVASFADQYAKSPEGLAAKVEKEKGKYTGDVNGIFKDLLQRGASPDEVDYFGRALASGQTTAYQLKQYVQSLPEYQNQQDTSFRKNLSGELGNYDSQAFNREKENILSSYTKAGLQNSSALDFAMTDALSKMQTNRDQFLGGLSAAQYGGNKEAALNAYQQSQNQYLNNLDYQRNQGQSNLNYLTGRADQGADYTRQMSDYLNYLNSQPRQKSGSNPLQGAIAGAGAGSAFGPWGALIGGVGGGALSYLNQ